MNALRLTFLLSALAACDDGSSNGKSNGGSSGGTDSGSGSESLALPDFDALAAEQNRLCAESLAAECACCEVAKEAGAPVTCSICTYDPADVCIATAEGFEFGIRPTSDPAELACMVATATLGIAQNECEIAAYAAMDCTTYESLEVSNTCIAAVTEAANAVCEGVY